MASFCLPRKYIKAFEDAVDEGTLDPHNLAKLSSAERREAFTQILGPDVAKEVNTLFEEKMLKPNQARAFEEWERSLKGLNKAARTDISSKIQSLGHILSPTEEKDFLADLTAKRLSATVTHEEAKQILDMSTKTEQLKTIWDADPTNDLKRQAYGTSLIDLRDTVEGMKPDGHTYTNVALNVLGIPKALNTSILHFSGPMVQAYGLIGTKSWWKGLIPMFKYFGNEANYKMLQADIITSPYYQQALDGGLRLTDISDKLSHREEALQSTYIQKLNDVAADKVGELLGHNGPYPINLVGASSRAFTGYLNFVRFDRFKTLVDAAKLANEDVNLGSENLHDLAKTVNDFTGGSELGYRDQYQNIAKGANAVFYAPRKLIATGEMFNPWRYIDPSISATVRKARFSQLTGTLTATAVILSLAKASGANINLNPISADFLTAEYHGEKFDITGGYAKELRLVARLVEGKQISSTGNTTQVGSGYKPTSRADMVSRYVRGKMSPTVGALWDVMDNMTTMSGQSVTLKNEAKNRLAPIFFDSATDYYYNNPDHTANIIPALAAFMGVAVESPLLPRQKYKMNVWGEREFNGN